jgi:hypothetical protein
MISNSYDSTKLFGDILDTFYHDDQVIMISSINQGELVVSQYISNDIKILFHDNIGVELI